MKERIVELTQQVERELRVDLDPTAERLGEISGLPMQKTRGMDAQRRPMSG